MLQGSPAQSRDDGIVTGQMNVQSVDVQRITLYNCQVRVTSDYPGRCADYGGHKMSPLQCLLLV